MYFQWKITNFEFEERTIIVLWQKAMSKHLIKLSKSKTPKHEYTFWDLKFNILPIGRPKYNKPLLQSSISILFKSK
jgi:hypothetical protein